jgi:hypothetical protein
MIYKGTGMQRYMYALAIALVLLAGTSAFCPNAGSEEAITAQEYEIFRQVLITQRPWSAVNPETMATVKAGADWLKPPAGIRLTADMANAFNAKNSITYKLSNDFLTEASQNYGHGLTGKKKITLTRPGFDKQMRRAMLIIAVVYYLPEDVMNEGMYVFLEKQANQWQVVHTAKAWDMRLGPTP